MDSLDKLMLKRHEVRDFLQRLAPLLGISTLSSNLPGPLRPAEQAHIALEVSIILFRISIQKIWKNYIIFRKNFRNLSDMYNEK
jgi:hypothetical protein